MLVPYGDGTEEKLKNDHFTLHHHYIISIIHELMPDGTCHF